MPEVANSIERTNKAIKIQDGEILFDAALLLWSEMQQEKPFLWHFSQRGEAVLYSLTITALLSKEQGKYYCNLWL